jgi:hypothetical protein
MVNLDGLVPTLVGFGIVIALAVWGCWELIDWIWIDDAIRSTTPIVPEIELVVKDNVVDTVYVYRQP